MGFAGPAEQQAQVVLDLRHRANGGTGVVAGGFLVDRNRRREPLDRIHIGLVHLAQELARIGRETLDVAALALGENRVECQGALAAAAHPGEHHQPVARDRQVNVLEVVLAGTPHPDHILQGPAAEHPARIQGLFVNGLGEGSAGGSRALGAGHPDGSTASHSTDCSPARGWGRP